MDCAQCANELLTLLIQGSHSTNPYAKMLLEVMQGEIAVLGVLFRHDGVATPSDISNELGRSASRIANTLNTLEDKQYIKRIHDCEDRRKVLVHLTPEGAALVREKKALILSHLTDLMQSFGEEDANEYVRLEKKLTSCLQKKYAQ